MTTHLNTGGITTYILRLVKPLREFGIETHVLSSGGDLTEEFQQLGAKTHELPIRTKSELHPKLYRALPKIIELIRSQDIKILHAHTRVTQVMAGILGKTLKIPIITTCHGFYKRRLGRILFPAWGDRVIAISDGVAESLSSTFGIDQSRVTSIYNAVDIEDLDLRYKKHDSVQAKSDFGFHKTDPVLGVVARLVEDKGHRYLIEAIPELQRQFPNIRLLIVGEGREKAHLQKIASSLLPENTVVFTGNLLDVTKAMAAMDIFVLPATWREGFGLSIIEAITCRKPVIVTNIWALNTLIQDHITGLMIEPSKTSSIVTAVTELLLDRDLRSRLSKSGRAMVEKLFSIKRMAAEIFQVYFEATNKVPSSYSLETSSGTSP